MYGTDANFGTMNSFATDFFCTWQKIYSCKLFLNGGLIVAKELHRASLYLLGNSILR